MNWGVATSGRVETPGNRRLLVPRVPHDCHALGPPVQIGAREWDDAHGEGPVERGLPSERAAA